MITQIRQLIDDTGKFKSVQLATNTEPLEDYDEETPTAIVFFGDTGFSEDENAIQVSQLKSIQIAVLLIAHADDVFPLEQDIEKAVVGYVHDDHYNPMVAVQYKNYKITDSYYCRHLTFSTSTELNTAY